MKDPNDNNELLDLRVDLTAEWRGRDFDEAGIARRHEVARSPATSCLARDRGDASLTRREVQYACDLIWVAGFSDDEALRDRFQARVLARRPLEQDALAAAVARLEARIAEVARVGRLATQDRAWLGPVTEGLREAATNLDRLWVAEGMALARERGRVAALVLETYPEELVEAVGEDIVRLFDRRWSTKPGAFEDFLRGQ